MPSPSPEHTTPTVAVIIPVFNDAEHLVRCLRALEEQTYAAGRFQVLVVDNGSSEDIAGTCRPFAHVRYVSEPRPGSYAARNTGITCSDDEVLAFTDADCLPHRDWLESGVARLQSTVDCGAVGGSVEVFAKNPSRPTAAELYESAFAFPQRTRIEEEQWSVTANLFVWRSVMEAVGAFNAELRSGGDAEWGRRAHAAGHRIAYAEEVRVAHPARASIGELLMKARRVAGGAHAAKHHVPKRFLVRYLLRSAYYCLRKTLNILSASSSDVDGLRRFTMRERLTVAAVLNLVTAQRLLEVVSLRLRNRAANRR